MGGSNFGTVPSKDELAYADHRTVGIVPATLKVLRSRQPVMPMAQSIQMDAARGEAESAQVLVYAGKQAISAGSMNASVLTASDGSTLHAEIGVVGYVPLKKPTLIGFWQPGNYPDPVIPRSSFEVEAGKNQALWYSVWVPRDAQAGVYTGTLNIDTGDEETIQLPVSLRVHAVTLPVQSYLKTSIVFRKENIHSPEYYGDAWTQEMSDALPFIGLKYRFTHRVDLPLLEALQPVTEGKAAQWEAFDTAVQKWLDAGITCFELKFPIGWGMSPEQITSEWGSRLAALDAHIVERGWLDFFYYYFYDEPFPRELEEFKAKLDAIKASSPNIPNVLTYGITTKGERMAVGSVGIWVPNIHQLNLKFARERQAAGDQYWIYTCIGNIIHTEPDNFRIDWHGTAHRALGWWLFKYNIEGYLYWGADLWRRNPWETTATFPWTNGDGMMFYPALDGRSEIYPSTRVHMMRDAFEDFDLLTMLRMLRETGGLSGADPATLAEVNRILDGKAIIQSPERFERDDRVYVNLHRRILEILAEFGS